MSENKVNWQEVFDGPARRFSWREIEASRWGL